jgi:hypothetical protein
MVMMMMMVQGLLLLVVAVHIYFSKQCILLALQVYDQDLDSRGLQREHRHAADDP